MKTFVLRQSDNALVMIEAPEKPNGQPCACAGDCEHIGNDPKSHYPYCKKSYRSALDHAIRDGVRVADGDKVAILMKISSKYGFLGVEKNTVYALDVEMETKWQYAPKDYAPELCDWLDCTIKERYPEEFQYRQLAYLVEPKTENDMKEKCEHQYSRSMNQDYPRKCVKCGKPEPKEEPKRPIQDGVSFCENCNMITQWFDNECQRCKPDGYGYGARGLLTKEEARTGIINRDISDPKEEPKQEGDLKEITLNNIIVFAAEFAYKMANPKTNMDVPSIVYERTEKEVYKYFKLTPAEPKEDIEFFKTSTPRPKMTNEDTRKRITNIIRENITFSGQIGDYIIHGAIEKLCDLIDENNRAWRDYHEQAEPKEEHWVSVEDRLPKLSDEFNVTVDLKDGMGGPVSSCADWDSLAKHWYYIGTEIEVTGVTHWMPLPEPPNSKSKPKEEQTELLLAFKKWYDSLTPRDKCTVWPPAGSGAGHGLYNQSDEDLIQKFIHRK